MQCHHRQITDIEGIEWYLILFFYQMSNIILCEPLANIILFYSTSSINSEFNLHKYNILFKFVLHITTFELHIQHNYGLQLKKAIFH
jgi:hypothetical protein